MTAVELLDAMTAAGCDPTVAGPRLAIRGRVPDHLRPALTLLHTGVRAHLGNRCWYGHGDDPAGTRVMLNPAALVPVWLMSLSVEGDMGARDRIPAGLKESHPELFAFPTRGRRRPRLGAGGRLGPRLKEGAG